MRTNSIILRFALSFSRNRFVFNPGAIDEEQEIVHQLRLEPMETLKCSVDSA
jgi:hypothetical protein